MPCNVLLFYHRRPPIFTTKAIIALLSFNFIVIIFQSITAAEMFKALILFLKLQLSSENSMHQETEQHSMTSNILSLGTITPPIGTPAEEMDISPYFFTIIASMSVVKIYVGV